MPINWKVKSQNETDQTFANDCEKKLEQPDWDIYRELQRTWERVCSLITSNVLGYAKPGTNNDCSNGRFVCNKSYCDVADANLVLVCDLTQSKQELLQKEETRYDVQSKEVSTMNPHCSDINDASKNSTIPTLYDSIQHGDTPGTKPNRPIDL